ncbi:extensin family protein [Aurantiacibacter hainanensis]|uniref:extensin family protein n=1 Tax=Aurantiacibacter hainanensis TaxID=3076114 RepID=UPI0030C6D894
MKRTVVLALATLGLSACSLVPQGSGDDYGSTNRSDTTARSATVNAPPPLARDATERQCLSELGAAGASFDALPDRYLGQGCSNLNTVQMHALARDDGRLDVRNLGPVTCPVSAAFAAWARFGVDRAAQQVFGSPLASIQTMGSFSCRNVAGTSRRSAHASADAIDIGGFVLADGRRISVKDGWRGSAQEREFLRIVQRSACRRFDTVLGPDYNSDHSDHLHVEGVIKGNSYCR